MVMPPFLAITRLVRSFGYDANEIGSALNVSIAGTVFGYGASLLKKQGVTLERTITILCEKWPGIQEHE